MSAKDAMSYFDLSDEEWDALPHKVQECLMRLAERKLPDGDYTLVDGCAWFTVGNISVRLHKTREAAEEVVVCDMYPLGEEMKKPLVTASSTNEDDLVVCSLCGCWCSAEEAHLHQGKWIGDECCWDERLRSSE